MESFQYTNHVWRDKMTKRSFYDKGQWSLGTSILYVCGPISTQVREGYEYSITLANDYSRYSYVYLMTSKSEVFELFKEFWTEAEKQLGKNIKALQ